MVRWKIALIIILIVILAAGISLGIDALVANNHKVENAPVTHVAIDFYADDIYLGDRAMDGEHTADTYDIAKVLGCGEGAVVESLNSDIAEITDNIITVKEYGELNLRISENGASIERKFTTINGVNIIRAYDLLALSNIYAVIREPVVLQNDITLKQLNNNREKFSDNNPTFRVKSDFYGNGHTVYCDDFNTTKFSASLIFSGLDAYLCDTRFMGMVIDDNTEVNLDDLVDYGSLVAFGNNSMNNNKTTVYNCVFENSNRNVDVSGADINFRGCLFRNAADANISLKTVKTRASNVSLENCVLANSVVAGITNWCIDSVPAESQCSITLKGFVDFYCWRDSEYAKIVPAYEKGARLCNGYLQDVLRTNAAKKCMYKENDRYYLNSAIVVICTGTGNKNTPTLVGFDKAGLKKHSLPFDWYVSAFLTTSDAYGYQDAQTLPPTASLADDPYVYYKMKHGK